MLEPWKANSMAFYRIDVVCFNCKQLNPQQRPKWNTPEHCSVVHVWSLNGVMMNLWSLL